MKTSLTFIGRIIYAIPLIVFGMFHFMNGKAMAEHVLQGWPAPEILVYVAGLALILAGVSIILNVYARLACLLLALLFLIFIVFIHLKGLGSADAMIKQASMMNLLKDTALLGAALAFAGILSKK